MIRLGFLHTLGSDPIHPPRHLFLLMLCCDPIPSRKVLRLCKKTQKLQAERDHNIVPYTDWGLDQRTPESFSSLVSSGISLAHGWQPFQTMSWNDAAQFRGRQVLGHQKAPNASYSYLHTPLNPHVCGMDQIALWAKSVLWAIADHHLTQPMA